MQRHIDHVANRRAPLGEVQQHVVQRHPVEVFPGQQFRCVGAVRQRNGIAFLAAHHTVNRDDLEFDVARLGVFVYRFVNDPAFEHSFAPVWIIATDARAAQACRCA